MKKKFKKNEKAFYSFCARCKTKGKNTPITILRVNDNSYDIKFDLNNTIKRVPMDSKRLVKQL